jgi:hypothetical protein
MPIPARNAFYLLPAIRPAARTVMMGQTEASERIPKPAGESTSGSRYDMFHDMFVY